MPSLVTLPPSLIMSAPLVRCCGCDKVFTPHGHSQHTSKTQRPGCRSLQGSVAFQSINPTQTVSSLAPAVNPVSWNTDGETETYGDTFARADRPFSTESFFQRKSKVMRMTWQAMSMKVRPSCHTAMPPIGPCIAVGSVTKVGYTGIPADLDDPADTADANTFETLNQDQISSPASVTLEPSGLQSSTPPPDDTIESRTYNAEASSTLVVDRFPHGHPGAPLSSEQVSIFGSVQDRLGDSIWSPFQSQVDWEIARWAKMRGPSSTALTELLAIPEVWEEHSQVSLRH